ncbi:MAG: hypothetical protein ABGZ35_20870 [Planctomycetaceae bacterium]
MELAQEQLTCQREAFELPEDICWLNSAYMSPLLHTVRSGGNDGLLLRGQPWRISADDFFQPAEEVRRLFAGLINANEEGIALVPSLSYGVGIAARNIPVQSGQNVIVVEEQFPSNVYPWRELAQVPQQGQKKDCMKSCLPCF